MHLPLFFAAALACAQAPSKGFVVRAESARVWLDLTAADGAAAGRPFELYKDGDELKHPVSGASLGRVQEKIGEGRIDGVEEKYSTGLLTAGAAEAKAGQRARWAAPVPAAAPAAAAPSPAEAGGRAPKTRGATLDFAVVGMAAADFDGSGRPQLALASENAIKLYPYPALDAKPLAEAKLDGSTARALGLEAADLDGDGRAELFVSVYDDGFRRFETRVLELEGGAWKKAADLPFLVRAHQGPGGAAQLAAQQVVDDKSFPLGSVYPLAFENGKYVQKKPALKGRGTDWLYGFNTVGLSEGAAAVVYLTPVHALRVQLGKEHWRTPDDDYGQTPVRVRWHDRLLEFNPTMPAAYDGSGALEGLYVVRNMAALGGLASPFGLFNRGELVRKRWNGLALENAWKADLPGCAQALALVSPAPGRRELAVAIRGSASQSSVWTFEP